MSTPENTLALADWRRAVSELYAAVRRTTPQEYTSTWQHFRYVRDNLFLNHVQSPLEAAQQAKFSSLKYFPYDPAWRVVGSLDMDVPHDTWVAQLLGDGEFRCTRIAKVHFTVCGEDASLSLFWIEGYGGGLFLPFRDATNGSQSYGGGRYLYDTIKGGDLGANEDSILLDFNYAYNPSCAYSSRWVCPLPPTENRLSFAVTAGEQAYLQLAPHVLDLPEMATASPVLKMMDIE